MTPDERVKRARAELIAAEAEAREAASDRKLDAARARQVHEKLDAARRELDAALARARILPGPR